MIVTRTPVPGLGLITNWDFNAPPVTPLGEMRLHAESWTPQPSGELSLEGVTDMMAAFRASAWVAEHRKWFIYGGFGLMAYGAFKLLF